MARLSTDSWVLEGTHPGALPAPPSPPGLVVTVAADGPVRTVLDVVAARCTGLRGAPGAVEARLASAASELAPPLSRAGGQLLVVGPPGDLAGLAQALPIGVAREAVDCRDALSYLEALEASQRPVVLVVGPAVATSGEPELSELVAAAERRPSTAVLLGGPSPLASHYIDVGGETGAPEAGQPARTVGAPREAAVVDVLGPVTISGVGGDLARHPKLTELAVYLSMHERGAPSRIWADALWPARTVPKQTIANRLSELRGHLGFAYDGRPRLRRDGEWHRLVDVRSDWGRFRALADPTGGADEWRQALELVRGRPFTGLREADWTRVEGHEAEIERAVTECALRLSADLLAEGDAAGAAWAAEQGLRAVPWDERLHRALMRAGAAAGNRGQVESTLRHLALALDIEGDPLGGIHPETARLYAQLSGRHVPPPG